MVLGLGAVVRGRPQLGYSYSGASTTTGQSVLSGSYLPATGGSSILGASVRPNGEHLKHVYFYAAPAEEAAARLRVHIAPAGHRSTKIVFIKAPSYGAVVPEVSAPSSQTAERTVIYVLAKQREEVAPITIPASAVVRPAKPEVYFIKYSGQQDGQQAVQQALSGANVGSNAHDVNGAQNFVNSLIDVRSLPASNQAATVTSSSGQQLLGASVGGYRY